MKLIYLFLFLHLSLISAFWQKGALIFPNNNTQPGIWEPIPDYLIACNSMFSCLVAIDHLYVKMADLSPGIWINMYIFPDNTTFTSRSYF